LRNSAKIKTAIVGGTGFEALFKDEEKLSVETPYGKVSPLFTKEIENATVIFLPRHGPEHSIPPHKVNYRANIYALHKMGVKKILATNAVGAINPKFSPSDIVVPHDFVDFTKLRVATFYDETFTVHVDLSNPYCSEIRQLFIRNSRRIGFPVRDRAVLVCTEGPRFETPAEIRMFKHLGCDIVGMTGFPEVVLARELEMCYATCCYVSNMAAGMQDRLNTDEVSKVSMRILPKVEQVLTETIKSLSSEHEVKCSCGQALKGARFKK
jgi:5'-methylthioadenosine phosphorylase